MQPGSRLLPVAPETSSRLRRLDELRCVRLLHILGQLYDSFT
jgi:hypothetical protein